MRTQGAVNNAWESIPQKKACENQDEIILSHWDFASFFVTKILYAAIDENWKQVKRYFLCIWLLCNIKSEKNNGRMVVSKIGIVIERIINDGPEL